MPPYVQPLGALLALVCMTHNARAADVNSTTSGQTYRVLSVNSGMAIDVPNGSDAGGVQVQQWPFWNGPMQQWNILPIGDGTYVFANVNSGMALDVANLSTTANAPVIQWNNWQGPNQRWRPVQQPDGSYELVNFNSGMCLDVTGISKTAGALLQQYPCWNSPNQYWQIQPIDAAGNPTGNGLPAAAPAALGSFILGTSLQTISGAAPAVPSLDPVGSLNDQSVAPAAATTLAVQLPTSAAGSLAIGLRVSNPDAIGSVHVMLNGQNVSGPLQLLSTGSSNSYQTVYVRNLLVGTGGGSAEIVFDTAGTLLHGVYITTSDAVPMIPYPAQIYFGGISFMDDLQQADAWPFVRANVDGFTFHSAAWGQNEMANAANLVQLLSPNAHFLGELGALTTEPVPVSPTAGTDRGNQWAGWAVMMRDVGHVPMHHLNINFDPIGFIPSLAQSTPWESAAQITQTALTQELDYEAAIHAGVPGMPLAMIYANPVFTTWKGQPAIVNNGLGGLNFSPLTDTNGNPVLVNGQPVDFNFDSYDFLEPYYQQAQNSIGYETDSPSNYLLWYGPENDPRNVTYRNKIYNYERWLHGMSLTHTQIINSDQQGGSAANQAAQPQWDQTYYNVCTQGIEIYQRNGGRADIYNAESWYSGPYTVVPETAPYSYTNLVMHLLKYVKGINETLTLTGPGGSHNVTVSVPLNSTQAVPVTVTNQGDVESMPLIAATETGSPAVQISYEDAAGNAITQAMAQTAGYVVTGTLAPQASETFAVAIACPPSPATRVLTINAFWNPQDPSRTPRDTTTLTIQCTD